MAVQTQIQTRRGTAASWTSTNPTLAAGEFGYETDTGKFKIGNGSTAWASLAYTAAATAVTYLFNATSGQTTFSGADANGLTLAYTVGAEQVYLNGVLQVRGSDYTATNGTSIVLASGALTSDVLNVIAYSAMTITDTYTQAQADAKFYQLAFNGAAGKNVIINGGMDVWQRGTSFTGSGSYVYNADRWEGYLASTYSVTQIDVSSTLNNFQYGLRAQRASGQTTTNYFNIEQGLETETIMPLRNNVVTVSFWARAGANFSATSGQMGVTLFCGTGTERVRNVTAFTSETTPINTNATLTTTYQKFTFTSTAIPTTTTQMALTFSAYPTGTAGANDWFEITGVQLELGSIATPFARSGGTIAGELAACQRYYWRQTAKSSNYSSVGNGYASTTTAVKFQLKNPVTMRVEPSSIDANGLYAFDGASLIGGLNAVTLEYANETYLNFTAGTPAGSFTANRPYQLVLTYPTAWIGCSAEL